VANGGKRGHTVAFGVEVEVGGRFELGTRDLVELERRLERRTARHLRLQSLLRLRHGSVRHEGKKNEGISGGEEGIGASSAAIWREVVLNALVGPHLRGDVSNSASSNTFASLALSPRAADVNARNGGERFDVLNGTFVEDLEGIVGEGKAPGGGVRVDKPKSGLTANECGSKYWRIKVGGFASNRGGISAPFMRDSAPTEWSIVREDGVLGRSGVLARDESGDARVGALDELEAVLREVCGKNPQ